VDLLCGVLLSWAASLSHYPEPLRCPEIVNVDAVFMERKAGTRSAFGWYPSSGDKIYLDFNKLNKYSTTYRNSVIVHELVHWLQHENGRIDRESTCHELLLAEREAYGIQQEFIIRYGVPVFVQSAPIGMRCEP